MSIIQKLQVWSHNRSQSIKQGSPPPDDGGVGALVVHYLLHPCRFDRTQTVDSYDTVPVGFRDSFQLLQIRSDELRPALSENTDNLWRFHQIRVQKSSFSNQGAGKQFFKNECFLLACVPKIRLNYLLKSLFMVYSRHPVFYPNLMEDSHGK